MQNGLTGIRRISKEEALEREPHIHVKEAILVPQAGIVDYTTVSLKYAEKIRFSIKLNIVNKGLSFSSLLN